MVILALCCLLRYVCLNICIFPPSSYKEVLFNDYFLLTAKCHCDVGILASRFHHTSITAFLHNTGNPQHFTGSLHLLY